MITSSGTDSLPSTNAVRSKWGWSRQGRAQHGLQATGLGAPSLSESLLYRPAPEPNRWVASAYSLSRKPGDEFMKDKSFIREIAIGFGLGLLTNIVSAFVLQQTNIYIIVSIFVLATRLL